MAVVCPHRNRHTLGACGPGTSAARTVLHCDFSWIASLDTHACAALKARGRSRKGRGYAAFGKVSAESAGQCSPGERAERSEALEPWVWDAMDASPPKELPERRSRAGFFCGPNGRAPGVP
jgi:hypothetical protein